jgi:hypothetical protein
LPPVPARRRAGPFILVAPFVFEMCHFLNHLAYCAAMDELAGLSEDDRKLALDRFRLLQPHLEQNRSLNPWPWPREYPIEPLIGGGNLATRRLKRIYSSSVESRLLPDWRPSTH